MFPHPRQSSVTMMDNRIYSNTDLANLLMEADQKKNLIEAVTAALV
ncbi:hypothetical protein [Fusibacter sp. 3D3]|nr:hypothetical protein [Fusibacter sp. 3D3]GAU78317.1 hypothetical protein F3D3_2950 [Fusibacter sp. 3D3]